jgi:hypothetical protein
MCLAEWLSRYLRCHNFDLSSRGPGRVTEIPSEHALASCRFARKGLVKIRYDPAERSGTTFVWGVLPAPCSRGKKCGQDDLSRTLPSFPSHRLLPPLRL